MAHLAVMLGAISIFSRFYLTVGNIPGRENTVADCLSRSAYPAGQAYKDVSKHVSWEDDQVMREFIQKEKMKEDPVCSF